MKAGACLINNSRGTVVDLDALAAALRDGHLAGAALDVFPIEPSSNSERFKSPLQGLKNVILTPHIGGSTEEAQDRIGREVARKMLDYFSTGSTMGAVNFPQVQLQAHPHGARFRSKNRPASGVRRYRCPATPRLEAVGRVLDNLAGVGVSWKVRPARRPATGAGRSSGFFRPLPVSAIRPAG
jgi:hypothetical protein